MITPGIFYKNFKINKIDSNIKKKLRTLINEKNQVLQSLSIGYKDSFNKKNLKNYKNYKNVRIIGMGGSSLGTQAIYNFLKNKIKKNFKFIDNLSPKKKINNDKKYLNALISSVSATIYYIKKKKFNSVIINYDEDAKDLFSWYQQLVAESLGKKNNGLLPIISNMPKDNHSVMQLYLDGFKNNFFTFFYVHENNYPKLLSKNFLPSHNFLSKKNIGDICFSQKKATEKVFNMKNIPFRSFEIKKID